MLVIHESTDKTLFIEFPVNIEKKTKILLKNQGAIRANLHIPSAAA